MTTQILEYRKTDHFLFSQWKRRIDDLTLYKVLPFVECTKCNKDLVFVMPSFLIQRGIAIDNIHCLVLIIKQNVIITGFWSVNPCYLFKKDTDAHFQMIY